MFPCTASQLTEILSGVPADLCCGNDRVTGASIDTRSIQPGNVFFALAGTKSHGVLFADEAVAHGASLVVTDFLCSSSPSSPGGVRMAQLVPADTAETDRRIIRVPDTRQALRKLAMWNRRQSQALIVGVTGSVGKTTTREMIAAVLGSEFSGIQSPRNFNNELGVPLSLLQLSPEHDFGILEMAAARKGDIRLLAEMANPEFAVVTRVAAAHLESFGDLNTIRQAKQELPESIAAGGTVFLNADDAAVRSMATATAADVVMFGLGNDADVRASLVTSCNGICSFVVDRTRFRFSGGRHLVTSALAAIAVGRVTGINDSIIAQRLREFQLDEGRGKIVLRSPWIVVDDTYNASPASVAGVVASLADWPGARHRILVLGDMLELGPDAEKLHFDLGKSLNASQIDHALLFGRYADIVAAGAGSVGVSLNRVSTFRDLTTLQTMLDCLLTEGDVVWLKGSRAMKLEQVVRWLMNQASFRHERTAA